MFHHEMLIVIALHLCGKIVELETTLTHFSSDRVLES